MPYILKATIFSMMIQEKDYFDPAKKGFLSKTKKEKIEKDLSEEMIVPSFRLKVNFLNLPEGVDTILVPFSLNLKRLS